MGHTGVLPVALLMLFEQSTGSARVACRCCCCFCSGRGFLSQVEPSLDQLSSVFAMQNASSLCSQSVELSAHRQQSKSDRSGHGNQLTGLAFRWTIH